jgi:hypothetical protein
LRCFAASAIIGVVRVIHDSVKVRFRASVFLQELRPIGLMDTTNIGILTNQKEQAKRTVELVGDLHRQLKIEAARRGVDMKEAIAEAVEAWLRPPTAATLEIRDKKKTELSIPAALAPVVELLISLFEERNPMPGEDALKASLLAMAAQYQRRLTESTARSAKKLK